MQYLVDIIIVLLVVNTLLAIYTVFHKQRSITSVLAWILTLVFLPGIGFILYSFLGRGLAKENLFQLGQKDFVGMEMQRGRMLKLDLKATAPPIDPFGEQVIDYFDYMKQPPLTHCNKISFYTDGEAKFKALFADIEKATESVHVEYYSFFNDAIGNEFLDLLTKKAKEGVQTRLIYDPWGSPGANKKWFQPFVAAGGEVAPFITSRDMIRKTRLNYHLHRKIVVLDGQVAWTGGFNVGDQYLGRKKKFGYWRDTHIRVTGPSIWSLQEVFLMDWNASVRHKSEKLSFDDQYFQLFKPEQLGVTPIQIAYDGPDSQSEMIKAGFIRMIMSAKESILIQSPYLIPDESVISALVIAARSNVNIKIMIPCMPDHPFIYRATQYYANYLHSRGIEIYMYQNGFLHAKTMVIDGKIATVGTANQDIRSYALNFETNAFIYDKMIAQEMAAIFESDLPQCERLTDETINGYSHWLRFKQYFSRLLSPIL
ncbi:cardiolipin synthase [Enterococcus canis]|uniref:Cardiolipin synthase n=1 Tax=Enterococcus canis TaxID=214095 RepID=A0A1L8RH97_9ENTE|nr:cardiolipin synthase [Enterococcus canis]OJG19140.1 cardiolipin synthase [Enterococcus canis]